MLLRPFENLIGMAAQVVITEREFVEMKSQAILDVQDSIRRAQMPVHLGTGSGDDEYQHFIARDEVFDQCCMIGQPLLNGLDRGRKRWCSNAVVLQRKNDRAVPDPDRRSLRDLPHTHSTAHEPDVP